jgi:hypothetical protein
VAIFFSPSPQGDEDEELYEKNAGMKEVDGVIISSIHRITGNEYFKQLFLRQSQNCFSARSAKEPSTQKSRLWDFFAKNGRFSPLQYFDFSCIFRLFMHILAYFSTFQIFSTGSVLVKSKRAFFILLQI